MHRLYWKNWDLEVIGHGRAFEETSFTLPRQRLALDGGWGRSSVFAQPNLFLSHLHMDHALGLPRYVVNRQKMGDGTCRIFVPEPVLDDARAIVAAWQRAERRNDAVEWVAVNEETVFPLDGNWQLLGVPTPHSIPSMGCILRRKLTRVRDEFADLPSVEIGRLVREGKEPVVTAWVPVFAYLGDTGPQVFDRRPDLYAVRVLLTECTFVSAFHEEAGETYGHTQWEDLCARADKFENEAILLSHFSKRYAADRIWQHLNATAPDNLRARLRPLLDVEGTGDRGD